MREIGKRPAIAGVVRCALARAARGGGQISGTKQGAAVY